MTDDDRREWTHLLEERLGLMGILTENIAGRVVAAVPSPADLARATDSARRLQSLTYGATETAPSPPVMATQTTLFGARK